MFVKKSHFVIIALFITICFSNIYSQSIGKLYTKEDANRLYGEVLEPVEIPAFFMEAVLKNTNDVVMFKIIKGKLVILGDDRKSLLSSDQLVSESDPFYTFSKDKVLELLKSGNSKTVVVEQRSIKLTITNGAVTLQEAIICPPFCR